MTGDAIADAVARTRAEVCVPAGARRHERAMSSAAARAWCDLAQRLSLDAILVHPHSVRGPRGEGDSTAVTSPWPLIDQEREALADDLATLSGGQWSAPSLLLAMTGRGAALADLSGEGLAALRSRA